MVHIFVNEIASIIGYNKYQNSTIKCFETLWLRVDKDHPSKNIKIESMTLHTIKKIKNITMTDKQIIKKILPKKIINNIENDNAVENKINIINEVKQQLIKKKNIIINNTNIIEKVENIINTNAGIKNELNIIYSFEQNNNIIINKQQQYKYKVLINNICIGGRCDGTHPDFILEVKNRINHFMRYIPKYEIIQVQLYMYIFDYNKCKLIENYNNENKETFILKDDYFINNILEKLKSFLLNFNQFIKNKKQKINYINMSNEQKYRFIILLNPLSYDDL